MRPVLLESPHDDPEYAKRAMSDSLKRGEVPLVAHLLYNQVQLPNDKLVEEFAQGWVKAMHGYFIVRMQERGQSMDPSDCYAVVFYVDKGMTPRMQKQRDWYKSRGYVSIERRIDGTP